MNKDDADLTVLYNGACPICRREVDGYRRSAEAGGLPLAFEDLNHADLTAWGVGRDEARRRLHLRRSDGTVLAGLPAFAALWDRLPHLRWLSWLVRRPLLRPLAGAVYDHVLAPALFALDRLRRARQARRARG